MIESRCGLLCSKCSYKEPNNCPGCVNAGKVFWGECRIKSCCESKQIAHCGECAAVPCGDLKEFSYAEEHGDNGERIRQCRKWSGEGA